MTRREIATFITGSLIGAALLAPLNAQERPGGAPKKQEQGCGGCAEGAAPAAVQPGAVTPLPAEGCCPEEAPAPAAAPTKPEGCCPEEAPAPAAAPTKPEGCCPAEGEAAPAKEQCEGGSCSEQASMQDWIAAGTPGEAHRKLDAMVGTWTSTTRSWMEPGAAPVESTGLSINTWDMGGRYLEQRYIGQMPGGVAFEGHGFTGFDNCTGKYFGLWMDSMSTGAMVSTGDIDATGKVLTFRAEMKGPNGVCMKYRYTVELTSNDRNLFTMWQATGEGPETKVLEMANTRR